MLDHKRCLLLIEDDLDDERLFVKALSLSESKVKVIVARDGEEALLHLFGQGNPAVVNPRIQPIAILVDLNLPKVNGLEFLGQLRKNPNMNSVPVIVLSSSEEEMDILSAYRLGANSYVVKPHGFTEFVEFVRFIDLYWGRLNSQPPTSHLAAM